MKSKEINELNKCLQTKEKIKNVCSVFVKLKLYVIFLLIQQNLGPIFCAPKIGYQCQKQPALPCHLFAIMQNFLQLEHHISSLIKLSISGITLSENIAWIPGSTYLPNSNHLTTF